MLGPCARRPSRPVPDVFETFAHRVDSDDGRARRTPRRGAVARSAGITVGLMVLTSWPSSPAPGWPGGLRPELVFTNLLWEGVAITAWSFAWGALAAMAVLAVGVVAVGLPWVRRQREARATSTSTP